mmetsp:Transcript_9822/g.22538  ORF Transcript_9822/g.22538 Transcript_9822/m.22538 type:complete len:347 (+) Transcript_9822:38-1078(+)|eukprot:CAMPEP_0114556996 /NCGR_PEP_ID=MMETSP0114-20121206/9586_1 /TAXON_ID=31324 /ORGANISM="Goniomonas sp, Strain m" /LENGTH=346 /DNA_ID=CAMNT_0001742237 /DNA_START=14 /DNA_END=1054 /DNA_ORIENTATION=-
MWSPVTSLGWTLLQSVCLTYVFFRDRAAKTEDYSHIWLHMPILLQEFVQFLLWLEIGSDADHCSDLNKIYSLSMMMILSGTPMVFAFWASMSIMRLEDKILKDKTLTDLEQDAHDGNKLIVRHAMMGAVLFSFSVVSYSTFGYFETWYPYCTFAGPFGLQVWPMVEVPNVFLKYSGYAAFFGICAIALGCYRGEHPHAWFVRYILTLLGGPIVVPAWWLLGSEFAAMWASLCGLTCFAMVIEPWAVTWHESKGWSFEPEQMVNKKMGLNIKLQVLGTSPPTFLTEVHRSSHSRTAATTTASGSTLTQRSSATTAAASAAVDVDSAKSVVPAGESAAAAQTASVDIA